MAAQQAHDVRPSQPREGERGAALLMVEATPVSPEGRISPADCGLWNDAQAEAFAPITAFIAQQGAVIFSVLGMTEEVTTRYKERF